MLFFCFTGSSSAFGGADVVAKLDAIEKKVDKLDVIAKKVDKLEWKSSFLEFCPWLDMAETDRSRSKNLRASIFNALGVNDATVVCWVTGRKVPVKVAHILPDSTKNLVMQRLELHPEFRNSTSARPSNFMILDANLEEAFDAMKISFSPADKLHPDKLKLKIWDDACRDDPVGGCGASAAERCKIGDWEGCELRVPSNWSVSMRALSYHTLCCYIYQRHKGTLSLDVEMPADFSSQSGEGKDTVRRELAEMVHSSIRADKDEEEESVFNVRYEGGEAAAAVTGTVPKKKRTGHRRCAVM